MAAQADYTDEQVREALGCEDCPHGECCFSTEVCTEQALMQCREDMKTLIKLLYASAEALHHCDGPRYQTKIEKSIEERWPQICKQVNDAKRITRSEDNWRFEDVDE